MARGELSIGVDILGGDGGSGLGKGVGKGEKTEPL